MLVVVRTTIAGTFGNTKTGDRTVILTTGEDTGFRKEGSG